LKPGDVVVGVLVGAVETKVRPAVVIASATYLAERPDALVGILTTKLPERWVRQITFFRTGNPPGSARSPAF
jgi:mRNA-degrading endonuclease toxin of MazEF toxin-antitoxin module